MISAIDNVFRKLELPTALFDTYALTILMKYIYIYLLLCGGYKKIGIACHGLILLLKVHPNDFDQLILNLMKLDAKKLATDGIVYCHLSYFGSFALSMTASED